MKIRFIPFFMALLGFASCKKTEEYGCPYADYQVKGKVTTESGAPIPNILVEGPDNTMDRTKTDGSYQLTFEHKLYREIPVNFFDTDEEENGGEFASKTLNVAFEKSDLDQSRADGWFEGEYRKENIDMQLTPKNKSL